MKTYTFEHIFQHDKKSYMVEYQMDYDTWEYSASVIRIETMQLGSFVTLDVCKAALKAAESHAKEQWIDYKESTTIGFLED